MAKQALRMCDDTQPGKMIQHIDIESSMEARNKNVSSGMDEVRASLERQNRGASAPSQEETVKEDDFFSESAIQKQTENESKEETPQDSVKPDEFFSEAPLDDGGEMQEENQNSVEDIVDGRDVVENDLNEDGNESPRVQTIEEFNASIGDDALFPFDNPTSEEHRNNDFDEYRTTATSDDIAHKHTADSIFRRMKKNNVKNG
jgi:hypothetical protein